MNNLRYKTTQRHDNGNIFWCFERGERLDGALSKWNEFKRLMNK